MMRNLQMPNGFGAFNDLYASALQEFVFEMVSLLFFKCYVLNETV